MATKITELTTMPNTLAVADVFPFVDASAGVTYKVALSTLFEKMRYDSLYIRAIAEADTISTGTGKFSVVVPASLNGVKVIGLNLYIPTTGSSGTTQVYVRNVTQGVYIGSTYVSMAYNYNSTYASGTGLSSFSHTLATGNILRIDVNAAAVGVKGLDVILHLDKLG